MTCIRNSLNRDRSTPNGQSRIICYNKGKSATRFSSNKCLCGLRNDNRLAYGFHSNAADKDTESTILLLPVYLCRRLLLPVIVVPDRMVQKLLDQRSTPQGAG